MQHRRLESLWLDYAEAGEDPKLLANLSGAAAAGHLLWTASDEGRTLECLTPAPRGFRLHRQVSLDTMFPALPGRGKHDEADLESLDVYDGQLWSCGSHCHVRREPRRKKNNPQPVEKPRASRALDSRIRRRPSRRLLGALQLGPSGDLGGERGQALPYTGRGSLRRHLARNAYIKPFAALPSKENGIDIEGMVVFRRRVLLGLRGPVIDSVAVVAEIAISPSFRIAKPHATHFVDLQGLGTRDLTRWKDRVLILAGPVSKTDGPFRLFQWQPRHTDRTQHAELVYEWEDGEEHPEAICTLMRGRSAGLLVLYDSPDKRRIRGTSYRADWIAAAHLR
jgi:hypothetical protein